MAHARASDAARGFADDAQPPNKFEESKTRYGVRDFPAAHFPDAHCETARPELNRCRVPAAVSKVPSDSPIRERLFAVARQRRQQSSSRNETPRARRELDCRTGRECRHDPG